MELGDYKKIFTLKKYLVAMNLGLADPILVKLSTAINSHFDLWPKSHSEPKEEVLPPAPKVKDSTKGVIVSKTEEKRRLLEDMKRIQAAIDNEGVVDSDVNSVDYGYNPGENSVFEEEVSEEERQRLIEEFHLDKNLAPLALIQNEALKQGSASEIVTMLAGSIDAGVQDGEIPQVAFKNGAGDRFPASYRVGGGLPMGSPNDNSPVKRVTRVTK
jgi:hypothetical protein